jgi:hypothetical protein
MWRGYLFDEPELEQYLALGRVHRGRLARDAARLIDELRAGRQVLGKHTNWSERLTKVRGFDLDPRRATEREAEAAAAAARAEAERLQTVAALNAVDDDGLAAFIHARANNGVLEAVTQRVLPLLPPRAQQAIDVTIRAVHSRDGRSYSEDADEVIDVLAAASSHPALQAWALALINHGNGDTKPTPGVGYKLLSSWAARGVLTDAVGLALVERMGRLTGDESRHSLKRTLEVFATQPWSAVVTTSFVGFLRTWLPTLPTEGAFDTSLHFDELNGQAALCTGTVLRNAPHELRSAFAKQFLPMATTASTRWMHKTKVRGALGVALLDPTAFNHDVFAGLLAHMEQFRSDEEGSDALLAIALAAAGQSPKTCAAWAERLQELKISDRDVELQALRAVALFALQTKSADDVDGALVHLCTASAYKEEYRQKRHALTQRVLQTVPAIVPTTALFEVLADSSHDAVSTWARARLPSHATPAKRITWLDVEHVSDDERLALLADVSVVGRHHAARALVPAARDDDAPATRFALEAAVRHCVEGVVLVAPPPSSYFAAQAPIPGMPAPLPAPGVPRELTHDEDRLLTEGVWALLRMPLRPSTVALCAQLLQHHHREVKDPVLRNPPDDIGLEAGMRQVVEENYGWQASTAKAWLQAHGMLPNDDT